MKLFRLIKFVTVPVKLAWASFAPVSYAKWLGVKMTGKVMIYGSSYKMFSAEPYLVTLEDNVFISVDAMFICHDGGVLPFRKEHPTLDLAATIHVSQDTFIGARATILKGVSIGARCIVAAGAVVTKSVPEGSIVGGNPARILGRTDDYIVKAQQHSLGIGHLYGAEKVRNYKAIFKIDV